MTGIPYLNEVWKDIPGYHGYLISNFGRIKGPGKIGRWKSMPTPMNPMQTSQGYLYVFAKRPNVPKKLFLHKAVLLAFVGPCPENHETRHLDGNPKNNNLKNLEWSTRIVNQNDRFKHGTHLLGENSSSSKLREKDVLEIRKLKRLMTARDLGKKYGVSHTTILSAVNGQHWRHI